MVVYAGRFLAGKASWISRMEHSFLSQSVSMIWNSSFDSLGGGTLPPTSVVTNTTAVCFRQGFLKPTDCTLAPPGSARLGRGPYGQASVRRVIERLTWDTTNLHPSEISSVRDLVRRWLVHMVNHDHIVRSFPGPNLQSNLFLDCRVQQAPSSFAGSTWLMQIGRASCR